MHFDCRIMNLPQGQERRVIVRTKVSEQRAQATLQRQAKRAQTEWEKNAGIWVIIACWIVGTNILSTTELADPALAATYKEQGGVERGFRFLKDPLFLASSVFVKKPERIMALSLIMVLCLLIYRLAEFRLRARLAEAAQTIPDQLQKPTARPTMHWVFQCFEGIELLHIHTFSTSRTLVLRLHPVHQLILSLLGPRYEQFYLSSS